MFVVLPNYIAGRIDQKLDAAIALHPDAEKDRSVLRLRLIAYFDEHGIVPDFELEKS